MSIYFFTAIVAAGSFAAGLLGALTGLGGGVVIVPLLTLVFHVDIRYAVGASLIAVIATSSGAAAAFVREGYSNIRLGMFLEVATTFGAIAGAYVAGLVPAPAIALVFGVVLLYSAWASLRPPLASANELPQDQLATRLRLDSNYPVDGELRAYRVHHVRTGFSLMFGAGILSGLLGIGSGAVKVLAMDRAIASRSRSSPLLAKKTVPTSSSPSLC